MALGLDHLPPGVEQIERDLISLSEAVNRTVIGSSIARPLTLSDLQDGDLTLVTQHLQQPAIETAANNVLETAARRIYYNLVNAISIDEPAANEIWNFLDILLLLSETRETGRAVVWYLVEELIESQTADRCRLVFDYLDARRDRLTQREFQVTHLIILRTCNELLRRLSRAEDAIFCGRVFFFLFQIFPLGEQSSVNLRGEFHTDNTTIFDADHEANNEGSDAMAIDDSTLVDDAAQTPSDSASKYSKTQAPSQRAAESVTQFYTKFWELQRDFSMPTRLIESDEHFNTFKSGLEETIDKFGQTHVVKTKSTSEEARGLKRRRSGNEVDDYAGKYNAKYLTSKELFSLELSDLSFQRHILVQALILLDFLLSLSEQALKKLHGSGIPQVNSSVNYGYTLSGDKREWVQATRARIASYLQQGPDGQFYYRMVNTVLARDKNWIWWKIQRCPPIVKDALTTTDYETSKERVREKTINKKLKARPMGAMDLTFLAEAESAGGLDSLRNPTRYLAPSVNEFVREIDTIKLDAFNCTPAEQVEIDAKVEQISWRLMRSASRHALSRFDMLVKDSKVEEVFGLQQAVQTNSEVSTGAEEPQPPPEVQAAA